MTKLTFEQQIQRLSDIEDIRILKHRYMRHCDNHYDPDGIAALFTEHGSWEGGDFGNAYGREQIRELFRHNDNLVEFAIHFATNEVIEVDGDTATGEWYLWQPMVVKAGQQAMWLHGKYSDTYVRENGDWLYKSLKLEVEVFSPYEVGFGKMRMAEIPEG